MQLDRYTIAVHEAGHAVMAFLRGGSPCELAILEQPAKDGCLGYCRYLPPSHWRDSVWVSLAGPVVTAVHEKRPRAALFTFGDSNDFDEAWDQCLGPVRPRLPEEFLPFAGTDHDSFMQAVCFDGWYPKGIRGHAKRRLTLHAKSYARACEFAQHTVHGETDQILQLIAEKPWIMRFVYDLADELAEKSRMDMHAIRAFVKRLANSTTEQMAPLAA